MCSNDDLPDAWAMSTTVVSTAVKRTRPAVRRWPAALTLAILAPLIAELGLGSIPASKAWTLPFFGYVYSAGALLIRELVRRRRLGVGSILALGLAYGLIEEGLALSSLTSTTLYPVADWAPRLLGFNTAFSLWVVPYHAVFSILVPIVMVDLIFPRLRTQPYLRTGGLIVWAIALLLGIGVIRLSLIWMDPDHVDTAPHLVAVGVLVAALVAWGLRRHPAVLHDRPTPGTRSLVAIGAVSVAGYFALLMQLPGAEHSAYLPDRLAWLAPVLALALLVTGTAICRRWSTSTRWSPVHSAALVAGALPAHSLLGLIVLPLGTLDRIALVAIITAEVVVGLWLIRRSRRTTSIT
jgi:hypothetical protein